MKIQLKEVRTSKLKINIGEYNNVLLKKKCFKEVFVCMSFTLCK